MKTLETLETFAASPKYPTMRRFLNWLGFWISLGFLVLMFRALLHDQGWDWFEHFVWFCLFVNYFVNRVTLFVRDEVRKTVQ